MATITKSFTEAFEDSYKSSWVVTMTGSNFTASGASFTFTPPTVTAKYTGSGKGYAYADIDTYSGIQFGSFTLTTIYEWGQSGSKLISWASGATKTLSRIAGGNATISTSSLFTSSNKTTRTVNYTLLLGTVYVQSAADANGNSHWNGRNEEFSGVLGTITLDAPPIFSSTQVSLTNTIGGEAYTDRTTASVTVSGVSAQFGGDVTSIALQIGNQTVTRTTDGTLSILLDSAGTFTPTVAVTDSRGQTTTKSLDPIVVKSYVAPEGSFTLERTNASGTIDDEGTYAVASATFNWTDAIATLSQPTVSAIDSDGTTLSVSATWYTDRALTTAVNWSSTSSWSSPKVLYGKIGTLPVNESSQITIVPNDSEGSGTAQSQTLASAFYTIDFLAGGHGIAFGQPASEEGFHCDMETTFNRTVDVGEEVSSENLLLQLDTTATSGDDHEIYTALVSLGWDSDVIV